MSYINNIKSSSTRITGLQSGFDTESIVKSLLKVDQFKIDKQLRIKTKLEWKGDAYREVNLKLRTFRESFLSVTSNDNVFSAKALSTFKATISGDSKAFEVAVGSNSYAGTYKIDYITQLAEGAKLTSAKNPFTDAQTPNLNATLGELSLTNPIQFSQGDVVSFSINNHDFTFSKSDTLSKVMTTIESAGIGVRMHYSQIEDGFVMTSVNTGNDAGIVINSDMNGFFESLGFTERTSFGYDAIVSINGKEHKFASNTFTVDGMTISLKDVFNTTKDKNVQPVSFTVARDTDAAVEKVKKFVEAFNELVDYLQGKTTEKINRGYDPLTTDEKAAVTEKEAEELEKMAKSGLLRNDSYIKSMLSTFRNALYSKVADTGMSPADIGFTTTSNYMDGGKIEFNEEAFRKAMEADPGKVASVFANVNENSESRFADSGLVARISDAMANFTSSVVDIALASNSIQLRAADDRLSQLQTWIEKNEERYWTKYTAMETALSKLQSQSDWLSGILSQMNSSK